MQYKRIFVIGLLGAFLLAGCSGNDSDGGDTPAQSQSCINVAGYWTLTYLVYQKTCGDEPYLDDTEYKVTQNGCSITLYSPDRKFNGNVAGRNITWSGKYYEKGITNTFNANVSVSGDRFSGNGTFTMSQGDWSCSGTNVIRGRIYAE